MTTIDKKAELEDLKNQAGKEDAEIAKLSARLDALSKTATTGEKGADGEAEKMKKDEVYREELAKALAAGEWVLFMTNFAKLQSATVKQEFKLAAEAKFGPEFPSKLREMMGAYETLEAKVAKARQELAAADALGDRRTRLKARLSALKESMGIETASDPEEKGADDTSISETAAEMPRSTEPRKPNTIETDPISAGPTQPLNQETLADKYENGECLITGDLEKEGFKIVDNKKSPGSYFGVSPDKRTFCVAEDTTIFGSGDGKFADFLVKKITETNDAWEEFKQSTSTEKLVGEFLKNNPDAADVEVCISICHINEDGKAKILHFSKIPFYTIESDKAKTLDNELQSPLIINKGKFLSSLVQPGEHLIDNPNYITLTTAGFNNNYTKWTKEENEEWITSYKISDEGYKKFNEDQYNTRLAHRNDAQEFNPLILKDFATKTELDAFNQNKLYPYLTDKNLTVVMIKPEVLLKSADGMAA